MKDNNIMVKCAAWSSAAVKNHHSNGVSTAREENFPPLLWELNFGSQMTISEMYTLMSRNSTFDLSAE